MKKILLFISSLGSGGAERQMVTLAKLLKEKNYEVSFLVYHEDNFYKDHLDKLGVPVHAIIENRPLPRIYRIRKYIRQGGYEAVISFLETPNFLNNIAAIGSKNWKVINSERSAKKSTFLSKRGKLYTWFQRYADTIICNSHNAKDMWADYLPRYRDKLEVIYNPVILPEITSEYIPKRNGRLHLVVAASYQYLKNPIGLIKAIALMNNEQRLRIKVDWYGRAEVSIGNTLAYDEAIHLINTNNLQSSIHLNPETKDIANKMKVADVVGLFSELEGLPNAICEGMMIGKPIIMSTVSDYSILVDESNGILCDWNDPESIKEALLLAMEWSVVELKEKGKTSNKKANDLFSSEKVLSKWLKVLENDL